MEIDLHAREAHLIKWTSGRWTQRGSQAVDLLRPDRLAAHSPVTDHLEAQGSDVGLAANPIRCE